MSGVPVVLEGARLDVLVVGGGAVATRRTVALVASGAQVRLVAIAITDELRVLARAHPRLVRLAERAYAGPDDIGEATLVIAATDDRSVNARVAADAAAAHRLASVADAPDEGALLFAAVHRVGDVVLGVTAGGVPGAASRVRDALAPHLDVRVGEAVGALGLLRRRLIGEGRRDEWRRAAALMLGADFTRLVQSGELARQADAWP